MAKQEPRPAYHRRNALKRLQALATDLPVVIVDRGAGYGYEARTMNLVTLHRGRYEVLHAYLTGWLHACLAVEKL